MLKMPPYDTNPRGGFSVPHARSPVAALAATGAQDDKTFKGLGMSLGNLSRLSHAKTRSISPENFSGEKGKAGMSIDGPARNAARDLGQGWKVSPFVVIKPKETFVLADVQGIMMVLQEAVGPAVNLGSMHLES